MSNTSGSRVRHPSRAPWLQLHLYLLSGTALVAQGGAEAKGGGWQSIHLKPEMRSHRGLVVGVTYDKARAHCGRFTENQKHKSMLSLASEPRHLLASGPLALPYLVRLPLQMTAGILLMT